ncbi:MAG: hypothetical protein EOO15_15130 [Chitinophagaceae bacterium]|nr:MAG: hypothetical protein EOO15_15130 [Chitinophagaceae bacterium]
MRRYLYHTALAFGCLVALLLPFPWHLLSFQQHLLPRLFGNSLYLSDSSAQAALYAALALLALVLAALLSRKPAAMARLAAIMRGFLFLYLAAVLARYGADKLLKIQFYLPEPTTLYTPFGQLEKNTLYWSVLGASRPYSIFLGATELLAAVCLIFPRFRRAGLLLALTVFIQVLAVDLCFGIDVRMFSGFLLLLTMVLLSPDAGNWWAFFCGRSGYGPLRSRETHIMRLYGIACGLILLEALWPVLRGGDWNDDGAARPPLHGAYAVLDQDAGTTLPRAQRVFVHRAGYLVLQDSSAALYPYQLITDTATGQFSLLRSGRQLRFSYTYTAGDSILCLYDDNGKAKPLLRARALNWRALPALH